jgi:hypothetical protein
MPLTEARLRSGAEPCTVVHACALLISFIHFFHFFLPPPPPSYPSLLFLVDGTADQDSPVHYLKFTLSKAPTLLFLSRCLIATFGLLVRSAAFAWANLRFDGVFALRPQARASSMELIHVCWSLAQAQAPLNRAERVL